MNASRRASAPVTRRATGTPLGASVDVGSGHARSMSRPAGARGPPEDQFPDRRLASICAAVIGLRRHLRSTAEFSAALVVFCSLRGVQFPLIRDADYVVFPHSRSAHKRLSLMDIVGSGGEFLGVQSRFSLFSLRRLVPQNRVGHRQAVVEMISGQQNVAWFWVGTQSPR